MTKTETSEVVGTSPKSLPRQLSQRSCRSARLALGKARVGNRAAVRGPLRSRLAGMVRSPGVVHRCCVCILCVLRPASMSCVLFRPVATSSVCSGPVRSPGFAWPAAALRIPLGLLLLLLPSTFPARAPWPLHAVGPGGFSLCRRVVDGLPRGDGGDCLARHTSSAIYLVGTHVVRRQKHVCRGEAQMDRLAGWLAGRSWWWAILICEARGPPLRRHWTGLHKTRARSLGHKKDGEHYEGAAGTGAVEGA